MSIVNFNPFTQKRSLQTNILIVFTSLLIITVALISGYAYRQNSRSMLDVSQLLIEQVTETVIEQTTGHLAPASQLARTTAQIPGMADMTLWENDALEMYGMDLLDQFPQLAGFFIGDAQGNFLFTKRFPDGSIGTQIIKRGGDMPVRVWTYRDNAGNITNTETTTAFSYDPRQRPWYEGAVTNQDLFWTDIYIFFTAQKPGITAAYPVFNEVGEVTSVIGIDVTLDELSQFLQAQEIGETGIAFVSNEQGEVVAYPNGSLVAEDGEGFRPTKISDLDNPAVVAAYEQRAQTGQDQFTFLHDNVTYIANFTPFPSVFGQTWDMGIVVPEDDFIGEVRRTNQGILFISFVILLGAVLVIVWVARRISHPIVALTAETERIQALQLEDNAPIQSPIREVQTLSNSIQTMKTGLRAFRQYVPAELVRQLMETGQATQLGGERRMLTILFTDIANFPSLSEGVVPEDLMGQLSAYLGEIATIIMDNKGTVDKYIGDSVMAFWGAPLPQADHAYLACLTALCCQEQIATLNERWENAGNLIFPTRIGIHTGETLVGNLGSMARMNYTILGDSVNLARQLTNINQSFGTEIIVSESTYNLVREWFIFRPLDAVETEGATERIFVYELLGDPANLSQEKIDYCYAFTEGVHAGRAGEIDRAYEIFKDLVAQYPTDPMLYMYLARYRPSPIMA